MITLWQPRSMRAKMQNKFKTNANIGETMFVSLGPKARMPKMIKILNAPC